MSDDDFDINDDLHAARGIVFVIGITLVTVLLTLIWHEIL